MIWISLFLLPLHDPTVDSIPQANENRSMGHIMYEDLDPGLHSQPNKKRMSYEAIVRNNNVLC